MTARLAPRCAITTSPDGTGNNDGNGSFAVVRITNGRLDVATARWLDDQGHYEWVAPFYGGPIS
ncbi:MAG TPA: hypothetical protein VM261_28770 [Kofleriaceae bacterium]|nr:hypothetical protein [Kofleriaceae bacterium]